jgi:hypothetical protein
VLKPFLRGKDVKRWSVQFAEQYLIKIESSENKDHPWSNKSDQEAELIFKETYPAIWMFMNQYREQLIKRCDQGNYFWELRSCAYWNEFETFKILYQEIATYQAFSWDESNLFSNNKTFLIPGSSKFILALLNSSSVWFFLDYTVGKMAGGTYAMQTPYISQIPIPDPKKDPKRVKQIEKLVEKILKQKQTNPAADVHDLEQQINQHVYQLYDLTIDEISLIETTIEH